MTDDAERRCREFVEAGHGVVSAEQAQSAGYSRQALWRLVARGLWRRLNSRAYLLPGASRTWLSDLTAACHWGGHDSFASHRSAALVLELEGIEATPPEISLYSGRQTPGIITHRLRPSDLPRTRVINGIRVTSVERTLLDLAGVVPPRVTGLALDDALRRRLTNLDRVWKVWETDGGNGRKGTRKLRILLTMRDHRDSLLATRFEKKMRRILRRIQPAKLVEQCRVQDGTRNYYIDFAYPHALLGIECHSIKWHMGEERFKRDLARDRRLKLLGWTILYFSWDDVVFNPDRVEAEVHAALARFS